MRKAMMISGFVMFMCVGIASVALALAVARNTVTLGTTTGTGSYTNSRNYAAEKLVSLQFYNSLDAGSTVTVKKVTNSGALTNTVVALALSSGGGSYYLTNSVYVFKNDVLTFANSTATGAVVEIISELAE